MTRVAVVSSVAAFLAFVERALMDWRFVPEVAGSGAPWPFLGASGAYVVFLGLWLVAILAASHGRRVGLVAAGGFALVVAILLGVGTTVAFCPTPCATAWPLLEVGNWANTVSGLVAAVACGVALRRPQRVDARGADE